MEQSITLSIPSDFDFKSLNLRCDRETLDVQFDLEPLEQLGIENAEEGSLRTNRSSWASSKACTRCTFNSVEAPTPLLKPYSPVPLRQMNTTAGS